MTILQRYVQREFLKVFVMCFSGLIAVYFLVDFFQRIELFLNYPTPVGYKFLYFVLKLPLFVYHTTPVAVLVALLVSLGMLQRHREVIAAQCAGIPVVHLCVPLVLWGFALSVMVFLNSEFLVPRAMRQSRYVLTVKVKNRPLRSLFRQNRIWYYGENNTIYNIDLLDPVERSIEGVVMYRFDQGHTRLVERVDARSAQWKSGIWTFKDATVRTFNRDGTVAVETFRSKVLPVSERPQDISQYREDPEEMDFRELGGYVEKLRRSGFNPVAYIVDLYAKTSLPFVSAVVAVLAIPFAFASGPRGGVVASLGMSLTLGFAYWIVISIGISLGHAGRLPPLVAAWLPNVFFLGLGGYLWLRLER